MTFLKIDEKNQIYYEYTEPKEKGCTFVFVNALTGSTSTWNGDIGKKIVMKEHGYLTYNFRGQEYSKFDEKRDLDTDVIVDDLCYLIEKLKLRNIILVGLSIGGLYAALALEKGIKILGLVLINTLRKNNLRLNWINETMVNVASYGGTSLLMDFNMPLIASPSFLEKMKSKALNPENYKGLDKNSGIYKLMKGSLTANWDIDWSKIDVPVLLMTGHYDTVFRVPNDIDEIANSIKKIERIDFPDCGHLIPLEKPNVIAEHIIQFAKKLG